MFPSLSVMDLPESTAQEEIVLRLGRMALSIMMALSASVT
jgi:hypothetical protein